MGNSDFLFARPSFVEGVARVLDFSGSLNTYNQSATPGEADAKAIYSDFRAVGLSILEASNQVDKELTPA